MSTKLKTQHDKKSSVDFNVENHGSLFLVRPLTPAATAWLEEHCPQDSDHQYFGGAVVVEPRYVQNLIDGIVGDGLTVQ